MSYKLPIPLFCSLLLLEAAFPQTLSERLQTAVQKMEADSPMKHAILSLYVVDAATGAVVFDKHSQTGLAPASCQKLFTSAAALDILGPDYRYKTELACYSKPDKGVLRGNLYILGSGDPTLGSWRYNLTKDSLVLSHWVQAINRAGIRRITEGIVVDQKRFDRQGIPPGWIWEDIGNYYGAGCWQLNWHENQYALRMESGKKTGDPVTILEPKHFFATPWDWANELKTAVPGSGDNAYIFYSPYLPEAFLKGTIPLQKEPFVISGSIFNAPYHVAIILKEELNKTKEIVQGGRSDFVEGVEEWRRPPVIIDSLFSPPLDSINYWFLKKSINLYGEALVKTMAYERTGIGTTEKGVEIVRDFWGQQGIDQSAMHIIDGSGLSPQNRVTTDALVKVLRYARTRPWYPAFYRALPEINGMRMKSGAIGGARSYAGYQVSKDGREYVFGMIVNNYDGPSAGIVKKMFSVLDNLK